MWFHFFFLIFTLYNDFKGGGLHAISIFFFIFTLYNDFKGGSLHGVSIAGVEVDFFFIV